MKVLILGGCGIQGRTAVYDLAKDPEVEQIICADLDTTALELIKPFTPMEKIRAVNLDVENKENLISLFNGVDIAIDLLPGVFVDRVCDAAIETRTSLVNTNYAHQADALDKRAKAAGIAIMPECGLDPGIDLVIYGDAGRRFDSLTLLNSYCGGFPEKSACTNPLNYKISWTWRGVLRALNRDARIIRDGKVVDIPQADLYDPLNIRMVEVPGLGDLEAYPNGDAVFFTDLLGVTSTIRETGRYSLRWPGWCEFWRPVKALGLTSEQVVDGLGCSALDMLDKSLEPKLQYQSHEKDLVVMINIFEGDMAGKKTRMTSTMVIERDLDTGIMGMSKGVGFTAVSVAKMIAKGQIAKKGVLSPVVHIPVEPFKAALKKRGIEIKEKLVVLE